MALLVGPKTGISSQVFLCLTKTLGDSGVLLGKNWISSSVPSRVFPSKQLLWKLTLWSWFAMSCLHRHYQCSSQMCRCFSQQIDGLAASLGTSLFVDMHLLETDIALLRLDPTVRVQSQPFVTPNQQANVPIRQIAVSPDPGEYIVMDSAYDQRLERYVSRSEYRRIPAPGQRKEDALMWDWVISYWCPLQRGGQFAAPTPAAGVCGTPITMAEEPHLDQLVGFFWYHNDRANASVIVGASNLLCRGFDVAP